MRLKVLVVLLVSAIPGALRAQSLDLYGIQVSLGMRSETVLRLFPPNLTVVFDEEASSYVVSKHDEIDGQIRNIQRIGEVWIREGRVSSIKKDFHPAAAGDIEAAVALVTRKAGMQSCAVKASKDDNTYKTDRAMTGQLSVRCGAYLLSVSFLDLYSSPDPKPSKSYTVSVYLGR